MRYVKDSPTSYAAALDNLPRAGTQRRRVYEAVLLEGERGITRDELERSMLDNANSIRPRVKELLEGGLIEETERTRTTRSGSQAYVLIATNSGVDTGSGRSEAPGASVHSGVAASSHPSRPPAGEAPPESLFAPPSAYDPWAE